MKLAKNAQKGQKSRPFFEPPILQVPRNVNHYQLSHACCLINEWHQGSKESKKFQKNNRKFKYQTGSEPMTLNSSHEPESNPKIASKMKPQGFISQKTDQNKSRIP